MSYLINILQIVLPVAYFATIWVYAKAFFSSVKLAERLQLPMLFSTLTLHLLYIGVRSVAFDHPPITSVFEIFSLIALTIVIVYCWIELRTKNHATGYFILILPFFFQLASSVFIREKTDIPPALRNALLGFHVTSALLGYAAITIAAVYGFLYLMLYHDIKSSQFSVIYKRLPNLETLERMSFTATLFGFVLLTIAITVGLIWLPRVFSTISYTDPKLLGTVAIWLIYGGGMIAKKAGGWQGRRMMVLTLFGFALAMFSMTIINIFFSEFHKFY
ncbi:MAG TPA: cytochrome c biogenesis protein CcsA [Bacteroidota bacterium]|nr:cytochrome c biogenesis protein CcsA [Bacteroidota bacterium]